MKSYATFLRVSGIIEIVGGAAAFVIFCISLNSTYITSMFVGIIGGILSIYFSGELLKDAIKLEKLEQLLRKKVI